jgi:peptidoglycan hydrolase CwlO-like protein
MLSLAKKILPAILLAILIFSPARQTLAQNPGLTEVQNQKAKLEAELAELEREIAEKEAQLKDQKNQSTTLSGEIYSLTLKIKTAKLNIDAKNLTIKKLGGEIEEKSNTITNLSQKINRQRDSLAQLLRKANEIEAANVVELLLTKQTVSEFYSDLDSFNSIKKSVQVSVDEIKETKSQTEIEKASLEKKQDEELNAKKELEKQKRSVEKNESEKKKLLSISKDKEKEYQKVLAERAKKAAQIRSALFALRDTAAIPFGQALEYANMASKKTGVRPAFLLAILQQETNMGANIGTCNRPQDPPEKHWREIMKPTRDIEPYKRITSALGLDPDNMPLSCPWNNGWGGAMGPSQFIPSTWELYASKVANALGISTVPNPWSPRDAFMASAIYLSELGANTATYADERRAALKYYAGSSWNKPSNAFYGNQVMAKAENIQENMIDPLIGT